MAVWGHWSSRSAAAEEGRKGVSAGVCLRFAMVTYSAEIVGKLEEQPGWAVGRVQGRNGRNWSGDYTNGISTF